jgi:hypothetical protein
LKASVFGIIGGILCLVSIVLPWWTLSLSGTGLGESFSLDASVYLYQSSVSMLGQAQSQAGSWYGWIALALIIVGSLLAFVGSIVKARGRAVLGVACIAALFSLVLFVAAGQADIASSLSGSAGNIPSGMNLGLFSSGSVDYLGVNLSFSTYLTFGFWITLVGVVLILASAIRKVPSAVDATSDYCAPPPPPPI